MKKLIFAFAALCFLMFMSSCNSPERSFSTTAGYNDVVTVDVDNYWAAYDKIITTKDPDQQYEYLKDLFLDKGTPGLKAIMQARRYKPQEYIDAINNYPLFWKSIRPNINQSKTLSQEIEGGINRLRKIYPELKPAKIYFTMGVFRTGGTTLGDKVLIGSETAMADENTITTEFSDDFDYLRKHWSTNPIESIVLTNVHEYVHTQQTEVPNANLLVQCLREGVAEFVSTLAMGVTSQEPPIIYGKQNDERIKQVFQKHMFSENYGFWLWSNVENEFGIRDLGYYVGYAIAEKYYNQSGDKNKAIKTMIELPYNKSYEIEKFVDQTNYFAQPVANIK